MIHVLMLVLTKVQGVILTKVLNYSGAPNSLMPSYAMAVPSLQALHAHVIDTKTDEETYSIQYVSSKHQHVKCNMCHVKTVKHHNSGTRR